jgi:hypothetical protein
MVAVLDSSVQDSNTHRRTVFGLKVPKNWMAS